jgi:hypothetical protein
MGTEKSGGLRLDDVIYVVRRRGRFPPRARLCDSHESGGHQAAGGKA